MFRNRSFRTKLALALAPPLLVLVALVAVIVRPRLDEASDAKHKQSQAALATANMAVRHDLQAERDATIQGILSRPGVEIDLPDVRAATDVERAALQNQMTAFVPKSANEQTSIELATAALGALDQLRAQIDTGTVGPSQVFQSYEALINLHTDVNEAAVSGATDTDLLRQANANLSFLRYKDAIARVNSYLGVRVESGTVTQTDLLQVSADLALASQYREQFLLTGSPAVVALERSVESGEAVGNVAALREQILFAGARNRTPALSPATWWAATAAQLDALSSIETQVFADLRSVSADKEVQARGDAILYLSAMSIAVILAALAAIAFGRSISRRLARVSDDAHVIASERLPEVLDALRNPTPEVLAQALPQVRADARDEIGTMAESFNTVLRTAVETSINHAERRSETLTNILVNLGRRNQSLIDRQLELVDQLESSQRDPEVLQGLFQLDHMITSLRRNAENLLVLASDGAGRSWSEPVPMVDVVRGAVSEVEDMSRIALELDMTDGSQLTGRCAVDLSHLLAELVDNALAFSPPTATVQIRSERTPAHYRVWILDSGLGMSDSDLADSNDRVVNPPDVDEMSTDRIGFQVVGRLSRRLGVSVRLQANPGGGTAASVTVPASLLESNASDTPTPEDAPAPTAAESAPTEADAPPLEPFAVETFIFDPIEVQPIETPLETQPIAFDPAEAASLAADAEAASLDEQSLDEQPFEPATYARSPFDLPFPDEVSSGTIHSDPPADLPRRPVVPLADLAPAPSMRMDAQPLDDDRFDDDRFDDDRFDDDRFDHDRFDEGHVDDASTVAAEHSPLTSSGLLRRIPGQAFVGEEKAQQFDSGQFRRLPMPGGRDSAPQSTLSDDELAQERLRALSAMQSGVGRGRQADIEEDQ